MMKARYFVIAIILMVGLVFAWLPQVFALLLSGNFARLPLEHMACLSFPLVIAGAFWAGWQRLMRHRLYQAL